ncbi:MAG: nucleotidyltransferase domain-containing protein [Pseudomonadota bacterium]
MLHQQVPSEIPPEIHAHILIRLAEVERENNVRILFAAESGSRAWGFPSPDSDYDVRFIYAHPTNWYLSLHEQRDVIECGIDDQEIDLSGWDVRKALRLLIKSNAALYEWTRSPIIYRDDGKSRNKISRLFEQNASRHRLMMHYFEYAKSTWRRTQGDADTIKLKRYFYAIRPLLACDWAGKHGTPPPMRMQDLLADVPPPAPVTDALEVLLLLKTQTSEIGHGPRVPILDAWIAEKLENKPIADEVEGNDRSEVPTPARADVEAFFLSAIGFEA